jgi:hypothetical protein
MYTNALIHEKSPYLRQHAHNPVHWLPWGEEAFEKARAEQKPIFLSVGYSTCHWCHVMAHESFENEAIAGVLNRDFVPVKLDREERPDVDRIYMLFVQASTGNGGWPMSVWLTPDLKPFFGGTYFPPDSHYGRPGFRDVLEHLARAWKGERERVEQSGASVAEQLRALQSRRESAGAELGPELFESAFWQFRRMFDARWGGFGGAPKFPRPVVLNYLLRVPNEEAHQMVFTTLRQMARGGMHDQLGGGFHRYSVDERWFVPHFEKMLYDQAQLAISYLEAFQLSGDETFAAAARDIFAYVLRDLRDPEGGFYSAEDADSPNPEDPGHSGEGAFYIWSWDEIQRLLGIETAAIFARHYGVEPGGNVEADPQGEFVHRNILFLASDEPDGRLAEAKKILFEARAQRPRPHLDDKILTAWNALMISALAKGYAVLGEESYKNAAVSALDFLLEKMCVGSDRLLRRYADGEPAIEAFLDDYAFLVQALLDVFEIGFDFRYLVHAIGIADLGLRQFEDVESGGFYSTRPDAPDLLLRMKDDYDGAEPSGNSVATDVLIRLARLTGNTKFEERSQRSLEAAATGLRRQPTAAPQMLVALGRWLAPPAHTIIRCRDNDRKTDELLRAEWKKFEPNRAVLLIDDRSAQKWSAFSPLQQTLENRDRITIYRCQNYTCELPEIIS